MSSMPWFPFWATDFLASRKVRVMTPDQVGVYTLLLCNQWDGGPLPDDPVALSNLCNGADPNTVRTVLEQCFECVGTGWENQRLEEVRKEQEEKIDKKRKAGVASGKARRRKKIEHRLNTVRTPVEQVESESDTEEKKTTTSEREKSPVHDMWEMWLRRFGGAGRKPTLTAARSSALKKLWDEQLKDDDDPLGTFAKVLDAVKASEHHMSKREYQFPDSLFRNDSRRDRWVDIAVNGQVRNGSQDTPIRGFYRR